MTSCRNGDGSYNSVIVALFAGTRLGPYEILSSLGAAGMGEVYCARDTRLLTNLFVVEGVQ